MDLPQTGNKSIAVVPVDDKVVRIPNIQAMLIRDEKKFYGPIKNEVAYAVLNAPSGWPEVPSLPGLKKGQQIQDLKDTLIEPDQQDPDATTLELDELGSFVAKKTHKAWIWLAICRKTRQIVAYAIGDRSERTCRRLWEAIPAVYRQGICYSDFLDAYAAIIPREQHQPVGKETGETAHIERFNNTLRQRLARFVRKALSFSKSDEMHEFCLRLFLYRYNMDLR